MISSKKICMMALSMAILICSSAEMINTVQKQFPRRCFVKNKFLKISHDSQENICTTVSFWCSCEPQVRNFIT